MLVCRLPVSGLPAVTARRSQSQRSKRLRLRRSRIPQALQMKDHRRRDPHGMIGPTRTQAFCIAPEFDACKGRMQGDTNFLCYVVCRFMIGSSDSDSEDDKRVIRSAKDRRFDELQATCHEIRVSYVPSGIVTTASLAIHHLSQGIRQCCPAKKESEVHVCSAADCC